MPDIEKTEQEWRDQLSEEEYRVCRQKGTERAFTGEYWNTWEPGKYKCRCCGADLFDAATKFDAGCGWPSFYQPALAGVIDEHLDTSYGMIRTEVTCQRCGAHLGHVFTDGPAPTGLRYCINSVSIKHSPDQS
ncbi:MAG TPA: peptide-methionine (R)-S-oxide reductase MsrB [Spongiibacteraceae bacterium]|nr:peptide-methionine (R)-S-oxide reductase MsrB [Spongiibacteraceae bacterium]